MFPNYSSPNQRRSDSQWNFPSPLRRLPPCAFFFLSKCISVPQARDLGPRPCFRLCAQRHRQSPAPMLLAAICVKVPRRRPRRRALSTLGWLNRPQHAQGGDGGLASAGIDCAYCRKSPRGLGRPTRSLSDSWASLPLPTHRVYTDSSNPDRVLPQRGPRRGFGRGRGSGNNAFRGVHS